MYDIFISYRRDGGADKARTLKTELASRGYRVFFDFDELKDGVFDQRIMDAIESAPIFMVLLTPHALDRCSQEGDWMCREIEYAAEKNRHFIPINPDMSFSGFPPGLPEVVQLELGHHQFSEIMFGQLFIASMDKMIADRIRPVLSKVGKVAAAASKGATIHIETDMDCRVMKFKTQLCIAHTGEDAVVKLLKGKHKLSFVGMENNEDVYEVVYVVDDNDMEDFIEVKLLDKYLARKAAEAAEEEALALQQEQERLVAERQAEQERQAAELLAEQERKAAEARAEQERKKIKNRHIAEIISALQVWSVQQENIAKRDNAKRQREEKVKSRVDQVKSVIEDPATNQQIAAEAYELAEDYFFGNNGKNKDIRQVVEYSYIAAEYGHAGAQFRLGYCFSTGDGVTKDDAMAAQWYYRAAEQGHTRAQNNLGVCYEYGRGVQQNFNEAFKWYSLAGQQGYARAQCNVGCCYYYGRGVQQNFTEAARWYMKAARQGYTRAQGYIGHCYYNGRGVQQNYKEAIKWYSMVADNADTDVLTHLGVCYEYGKGVQQDYVKAAKYYSKAAMLGDAIAQNNLGVCYEYGKGVRQDYNEAVSWYMRSAHQGCALAQYNLGVCYQYGRGVMPNAAEAMRWFHLANEQGNIHKQHKAYNNSNCGNLAQKIGNATSQGSSNYRSEEPADTSHTTLRGLSKFLGRK